MGLFEDAKDLLSRAGAAAMKPVNDEAKRTGQFRAMNDVFRLANNDPTFSPRNKEALLQSLALWARNNERIKPAELQRGNSGPATLQDAVYRDQPVLPTSKEINTVRPGVLTAPAYDEGYLRALDLIGGAEPKDERESSWHQSVNKMLQDKKLFEDRKALEEQAMQPQQI